MSSRFAKYSVALMPLGHTEGFSSVPSSEWSKTEVIANEKDITTLFDEFQQEIGPVAGPTRFTPKNFDGIRVYFDPKDKKSLFIVAETAEIADMYTEHNKLSVK